MTRSRSGEDRTSSLLDSSSPACPDLQLLPLHAEETRAPQQEVVLEQVQTVNIWQSLCEVVRVQTGE